MKRAADVTKHLAAARMLHGVGLGNLLRIFTFTDRRVIVGELAQAVAGEFVQTAVADVADRQLILRQQRQRQHAGHARVCRRAFGLPQDFVVRQRDRFANALRRRADRPLEPLGDDVHGNRGGDFTGGMTADAIDDEKDAAVDVDIVSILVAGAQAAAIARGGGVARDWRARAAAVSVMIAS